MISMLTKVSPSVFRFVGTRGAANFGRIHRAMLTGAGNTVTEARRILTENHHIITGNLRRSVRVESIRPGQIRIGAPAAYAYDVEMGPDGGYLKPAMRNTIQGIAEYVAAEVMKVR